MKSLLLEGAAAAEVARVFRQLVAFTQPDAFNACNMSNQVRAPGRHATVCCPLVLRDVPRLALG